MTPGNGATTFSNEVNTAKRFVLALFARSASILAVTFDRPKRTFAFAAATVDRLEWTVASTARMLFWAANTSASPEFTFAIAL